MECEMKHFVRCQLSFDVNRVGFVLFQYLRNILFQYMIGKETKVVLADFVFDKKFFENDVSNH